MPRASGWQFPAATVQRCKFLMSKQAKGLRLLSMKEREFRGGVGTLQVTRWRQPAMTGGFMSGKPIPASDEACFPSTSLLPPAHNSATAETVWPAPGAMDSSGYGIRLWATKFAP